MPDDKSTEVENQVEDTQDIDSDVSVPGEDILDEEVIQEVSQNFEVQTLDNELLVQIFDANVLTNNLLIILIGVLLFIFVLGGKRL